MNQFSEKADVPAEVVPTLYIGLGGTGAEVLWRIRRKILSEHWSARSGEPACLESLEEFPFAEFLQVDTNIYDYSIATKANTLADKLRFTEVETEAKKFDLKKYIKTEDALADYPAISAKFTKRQRKRYRVMVTPHSFL